MMGALSSSGESTKALRGSNKSIDSFASTFYSDASPRNIGVVIIPKESEEHEGAFLVEEQAAPEAENSYFEERDSSRELSPLTIAPTLREITNLVPTNYVPSTKIGKLDDLSEPPIEEVESVWGFKLVTPKSIR